MRTDSADHLFQKSHRHNTNSSSSSSPAHPSRSRSNTGYLLLAISGAGTLFFVLLLSGGDDSPWLPAGLATSLILLVAMGTREVMFRRAPVRYGTRERAEHSQNAAGPAPGGVEARSVKSHSAALRAIQKQSASADAISQPEAHLEAYHLCREYLAGTDEALRLPNVLTEKRVAMRAGQERVHALQKHHLLSWARGASRSFANEAQLRVRLSDKLEAATRALNITGSALKLYPDEEELLESEGAIREFMASVKVAHWLELAERAAFRGHYRRAIDRYRDALFYTSREGLGEEERAETVLRIEREIAALGLRLKNRYPGRKSAEGSSPGSRTEGPG